MILKQEKQKKKDLSRRFFLTEVCKHKQVLLKAASAGYLSASKKERRTATHKKVCAS